MNREIRIAGVSGLLLVLAPAVALAAGPCRMDEAIALFEKRQWGLAGPALSDCAAAEPKNARAAEYLGRALLAQGQENEAIPWLEKAVTLQPGSSEAHLWLGRAYAQQALHANFLKQASLASKVHKAFERAVALDPESVEARLSLIDYYLLAPGIMGGSIAKAKEQAAEIARRDAMRGHRALGRIAESEKKFSDAAAQYEKAMTAFPDRNEPVYWRTNLAVSQKDWSRAFDLLEGLLRSRPGEAGACYQIGKVAVLSGQRVERGEECLKSYLRHEPGKDEPPLSWAHFRLAAIYEKTGRKDLARQEYQNALRLDPAMKEAKQALAKLS